MQKYWSLLFAIVVVLCFGLFLLAPIIGGWWMPNNVSSFGGGVDDLFYLILGITAFFFVLTEALLVYGIWKFSSVPGRTAAFIHGNHKLEMVWTIIPAFILVLISILQIRTWEDIKYASHMPKPDGKTQQLDVAARQWEWRVRYPSPERIAAWEKDPKKAEDFGPVPHADDVHAVNEIHVWSRQKGDDPQRVLIHLHTRDVIHSFFLPNLRLKQDALPGKTIKVWFMAEDYNTKKNAADVWQDGYDPKKDEWAKYNEKKGTWTHQDRIWDLACAEFCGARHSMMKGKLYVHKDKADFLDWLKAAAKAQGARQPTGK